MSAAVTHHDLLDCLAADPAALDRDDRVALVAELEGLRCWLAAREAKHLAAAHADGDDLAAGARDLTQLVQQRAGVPFGEAKRRDTRARWFDELPAVSDAVARGELGLAQADDLCALAERLAPEKRTALREGSATMVDELVGRSPRQARKWLLEFEAGLDDDDGTARLERQRRSNRHRVRKNPDGTYDFLTRLDPISATRVRRAVDRKLAEIWRRETGAAPDDQPSDTVLSNDARRARALVELIEAGAVAPAGTHGGAEIVVVIDYRTLLGEPSLAAISRLADGTPIPPDAIRRLACDARIIPTVLGSPSVPLDVGRAARTVTPGQKTAIRAMHDSCCVAGCDVDIDYCEVHHVVWWRKGGRTDIGNLVPVCAKHHGLVHDHGWDLRVDADRVGHLTKRSIERTAAQPERPQTRPHRRASPPHQPAEAQVDAVHVVPMRC